MSRKVTGNTKGLAPSELRKVEKLYERRVEAEDIIGYDLAREIFQLATQLRRRIGVIISRDGHIEEVCIGTKDILYLPDLGRYRLGRGRLRRLRLVFSDLSNADRGPFIPHDIYADLEKLRLDMVVSVREYEKKLQIAYAHLTKIQSAGISNTHTETVEDLGRLSIDLQSLMEDVENELAPDSFTAQVVQKDSALLVGVYGSDVKDPESSMAELEELCRTAGVKVVDKVIQRRTPDPKTLLGKGKLEEVVLRCLRLGAELLVFDGELKPSQWRAVTNSTELKVLDRSMVILDIFAQRATSADGRLQVELAQLKYNLPRLVEKDTGLSRLSGGIGGRGPGETKLEVSRRRLRDRIAELERQIDQLGQQRVLRRSRQDSQGFPVVAILGYTNVGKSTLFNALTKSTVLAENKLFATLDPAQRRLVIPKTDAEGSVHMKTLILSDTVGFIRDLPAELRNAFRATLEQIHHADLLVHVLDASDPEIRVRKAAVDGVLSEMGVTATPTVVVLNKVDRISPREQEILQREFDAILCSAIKREGLDQLIERFKSVEGSPKALSELAPNHLH